MNLTEVRAAVDQLGETFAEFRVANNRRLAEVETRGEADPVTEEKVARLGNRLDRLETVLKRTRQSGAGDADGGVDAERRAGREMFLRFLRQGEKALEVDEFKALTVSDDVSGGYLAPVEYSREIIKGVTEFSPVREIARVRQTSQRAIQAPKRIGQFAAQWTSETGTRSETTGLSYGLEEVPTHEMYALVDISQQDLEDSAFELEAELQMEFAEQFGVAEGTAFVSGDGVGKPEGFMTNADVAVTNSGNASAVTADGLISLYHNVKTAYAVRGVWALNRTTLGEVRKLKDTNGQYLWQPGLAGSAPNTILGQPYVEMTDMPDVAANAFPVVFGNFRRAYLIVDRIVLSVLRDPFTQATAGNVRFIARRRVGGQIVLAEAIRKQKIAA